MVAHRTSTPQATEEYAIFTLDSTGHVVTWNAGAERIEGYAEEEILGRHFSAFYSEEDARAGVPEAALEIAAREGQWVDEGWRVRKGGRRFWARVTITALSGKGGDLRGFVKIVRDLTQQREREETLRRSEERYRRLFEESQEGIIVTTPAGDIIDINPAGLDILGYRREELLQMEARDLYADPETRRKMMGQSAGRDTVHDLEICARRKDGQEIVCRLSSTVWRRADGPIEAFQTFFRDVTAQRRAERALRESEEQFRALAEKALVGIGMLQDNVYTYVNPALARIFGYTPDELLGTTPEPLFHPEDWPAVERRLKERLEGDRLEAHYQARGVTKGGDTRLVEIYGTRITHRGERAVIGTVVDITERRRLEEQLLEIQEEERRRIGRELHDGVASELTGAGIMTTLMAKKARQGKRIAPEELDELTALIRSSAREVRSLSRGLSPVGLEQGLGRALEALVDRTHAQGEVDCSLDVTGELPTLSEETATHLYRIAQEAVTNAVKHAEASHIRVGLTVEKGALVLNVCDDGRGGAEGAAAEEKGLGLRSMRYRAHLTGSTLTMEEAPGGGTVIRCRLPA